MRNINLWEIDGYNYEYYRANVKASVIHAPYSINPSSPEEYMRNKAAYIIQRDMDFIGKLYGIKYYVLHPGSHKGDGFWKGLANLMSCLEQVDTKGVPICVETMAGGGTELFGIPQQLATAHATYRLYFTFDSAHVFQAGYNPLEVYKEYKNLIKVVHLNNSATPMGSHHDVHSNITGDGYIDKELLLELYHEVPESVPVILETPYEGIYEDYMFLKNS